MDHCKLTPLEKELLEALHGMFDAANEIAKEFIHHRRAADWGIVNKAYMVAESAIRKAEKGVG